MSRTPDWTESQVLDELLGNRTANGLEESVRVKVANFVSQLAAGGLASAASVAAVNAALQAAIIESIAGDDALTAEIAAVLAQKGAPGGIAPLGADSRVPIANLPDSLTTGLEFTGSWNASTNSPTIPAAGSGNLGHYYIVSVAGSTTINGISTWEIGDWIVSTGAVWTRIPATPLSSQFAALLAEVTAARDPAGPVGAYASIGARMDDMDATAAQTRATIDALEIETFRLPLRAYGDTPALYELDADDGIIRRNTAVGSGGVTPIAPGDESSIYHNVAGAMMVVEAAGEKVYFDPAPFAFSGPVQRYQGHPLTISDFASVGARTAVIVRGSPKLLMPAARKLLFVIICIGQSNGAGALATSIPDGLAIQDYPDEALMFTGDQPFDVRMRLNVGTGGPEVLNPATLTGFGGLISRTGFGNSVNHGVTPLEGMAKRIMHDATAAFGIRPRILFVNVSVSEQNYNNLKKGTTPHDNLVKAAQRAIEIGRAAGYEVHFPLIVPVHGEANANTATYGDMLEEWQEDIETDIKAKQVEIQGYAQAGPIPFLMSQPSTFFTSNTQAVAAMRARQESGPLFRIGTPTYQFPFVSDLLHLSGPGQFLHGEKLGQMAMRFMFGQPVYPLSPVPGGIIWEGGNVVRVPVRTPVKPIVLDSSLISDPNGQFGFRCYDSVGQISLTSVTVDNAPSPHPHVVLNTATVPGSSGRRIDYAWSGYTASGSNRVEGTGPRGCLRDSDTTVSLYDGRLLRSHCIHFSEAF